MNADTGGDGDGASEAVEVLAFVELSVGASLFGFVGGVTGSEDRAPNRPVFSEGSAEVVAEPAGGAQFADHGDAVRWPCLTEAPTRSSSSHCWPNGCGVGSPG